MKGSTSEEDYKRYLMNRFFTEKFKNSTYSSEAINFRLLFKDRKWLKYLNLPKSFYRKYYLKIITPDTEHVVMLTFDQKEEIKKNMFELK